MQRKSLDVDYRFMYSEWKKWDLTKPYQQFAVPLPPEDNTFSAGAYIEDNQSKYACMCNITLTNLVIMHLNCS